MDLGQVALFRNVLIFVINISLDFSLISSERSFLRDSSAFDLLHLN